MRKKKPPEHDNAERWLVSYADFITLLFAFFTTLYAISTVDAKKMGRLVMSMQAAFDPTGFASLKSTSMNLGIGSGGPKSNNSVFFASLISRQNAGLVEGKKRRLVAPLRQKGPDMKKIKENLNQLIVDDALRERVHIIIRGKSLVVSLSEAGFFDSGTHLVRNKSVPLLEKISNYILTLPNHMRVEGHTDDQPINTPQYPSNWELSTARATYIVNYLIKTHGFNPERLSAAGYAEYHPVASNETAEGRARNRRVDIIIKAVTNTDDDDD